MKNKTFAVIGHRGMGASSRAAAQRDRVEYPENTLLSFETALLNGADGIEFDVHLSRDGVPVVIHDKDMERIVPPHRNLGRVFRDVSDMDVAELRSFVLGRGQVIPLLCDVLSLCARFKKCAKRCDKPAPVVNIELKRGEAAQATHDTLKPYLDRKQLSVDNVVFCSFEWEALAALKKLNPEYKVSPSLKTARIFGKDKVVMPDYYVSPQARCQPSVFVEIANLRKTLGFDTVDLVIQDVRREFIEFCQKTDLGLYISVSAFKPKMGPIEPVFQRLDALNKILPEVSFKADRPERVHAWRRKRARFTPGS